MNKKYTKIIDIIKQIEPLEKRVSDKIIGKKIIGYDFNLKDREAKITIKILFPYEKSLYENWYNGSKTITQQQAETILEHQLNSLETIAKVRANQLRENWNKFPFYKKVLIIDALFKREKISSLSGLLIAKELKDIVYKARRNPVKINDNRIAKICYLLSIIHTVNEAREQFSLFYTFESAFNFNK